MQKLSSLLLITFLFLVPAVCTAALPDGLTEYFSPLEGYLVMPVDDQFLVDLDASKGLHNGDILSIIEQGKAITHPVSGEVIGHLDGNKTFLQITQLKSGYSYARQIDEGPAPQRGAKLTRFSGVPSLFVDVTGKASDIKNALATALPQLDWLAAESDVKPLLVFERSSNLLTVKSAAGTTLASYPQPPLGASATPAIKAAPAAIVAKDAPGNMSTPAGALIVRSEKSGIWNSLKEKSEPVAISAADLDSDGQIETALLTRDTLTIYRFSGQQPKTIASYKISFALTPIGLDIAEDSEGHSVLCISATKDGSPNSLLLKLASGRLEVLEKNIDYLFNVVDLVQTGKSLIGQKRDDFKVPFNTRPVLLSINNGKLLETGPANLPDRLNLFGFDDFTDAEGKTLYAYLNSSDYLKVRTSQEDLWESPEHFGGTETSFDLASDEGDEAPFPYYIPARVLVTGNQEILTFINDGTRLTGRFRYYEKGRFISLKWNGVSLEETWRTTDQNGYIADFVLADIDNDGAREIAAFTQFQHKTVFSKPRSALVVYEIE